MFPSDSLGTPRSTESFGLYQGEVNGHTLRGLPVSRVAGHQVAGVFGMLRRSIYSESSH